MFYFIEAMVQAARDMGLSAEQRPSARAGNLRRGHLAGGRSTEPGHAAQARDLKERHHARGFDRHGKAGVKAAFVMAMRAAQRRAGELGDSSGADSKGAARALGRWGRSRSRAVQRHAQPHRQASQWLRREA